GDGNKPRIPHRRKNEEDGMKRNREGLDRRSLFRYGAAGGALALASNLPGRSPSPPSAPPAAGVAAPFPLEEATFDDLQQKLGSGEETARSLVEKYLARIDALDRNGPGLGSVLE